MMRRSILRVASCLSNSAVQQHADAVLAVAPAQAVLSYPWAFWPQPVHHAPLCANYRTQHIHTSSFMTAAAAAAAQVQQQPQHYLQLDRLTRSPGSHKQAKRWGRGNGSDRGSYCGRGVKGQKARKGNKPHLLFDGGQKQLKKFPKVWLTPSSPVLYKQISIGKIARWVALGLLDANEVITMKDLRDSNCVSKTIRWGVELVANGDEELKVPLHLQVSSVSPKARAIVKAAGGSVSCVYYTRLGLRALLKPEVFEKKGCQLPRPVRAWPPYENGKFDAVGQLPPLRQLPSADLLVQQQSAAGVP